MKQRNPVGGADQRQLHLLSGLDVQNSSATGAVVALGASITDGIASAGDANRRWTNDLSVRLNQSDRTVGVLNEGISGNALLHDGAGQRRRPAR